MITHILLLLHSICGYTMSTGFVVGLCFEKSELCIKLVIVDTLNHSFNGDTITVGPRL